MIPTFLLSKNQVYIAYLCNVAGVEDYITEKPHL